MELYQLRSFVTVAALGHVTRAAERLHLSQPAVSAQLKALEDELGVALFERARGGVSLTAAGERLLARAEAVLVAAQVLRDEARELVGDIAGTLRVGTVADAALTRLGELLSASVERHARLKLELHHEISGVALAKVREGTLDASFYFGELDDSDIEGIRLREIVYRVAAPAEWRERLARADWPAVAALPWIHTPTVSTHNHLVRALFREHDVVPTRVVEADHESDIVSLIKSGVGLSLMREDLARELEDAGEVCVWAPARAATTLWFIYPTARQNDSLIAALADVVREIWRTAPTEDSRGIATKSAAQPAV
jgi:DNA-binding transcriptional LysR family regulator